jgi:VIT1/CCC1 family predicted Fe2+/Mn2+ transporter
VKEGGIMKFKRAFNNTLTGLYHSFKRFPLTLVFSTLVATLLIIISELHPAEDTLSKVAMVLALGMPLSLSIRLHFENKDEETTYKLPAAYTVGVFLLVLYYFLLMQEGTVAITRYIAVSLFLYLTFLFTPYLNKRNNFEMYVITIATSLFITVIYSIVLFGGLSAILFSINKLLGIRIIGEVYYYTWLFVVFIFAVSYFLSGIPAKHKEIAIVTYPKLLRILLLYIVMPLLTVYTVILYIYFIKVIVTMQWPVGIVSHLVLWYSAIVTIVLFLINPIHEKNNWAYRFIKFAPKVLLPLLLMMFTSMGIRIKAYGVTEPRYYVIILALWVFCIMLYFSFSKKFRSIVIPVSLALVALLSVFGPLSSYSVSKYSQNYRLEKILIKNNMLKSGTIQSSPNISTEDKINISSILEYFKNNHSLEAVKYLPQGFRLDDMNKVFGFSFESPMNEANGGYFYYRRNSEERAFDIKGYDYFIDMRGYMNDDSSKESDFHAIFDYEGNNLKISYKGKELYEKNFTSFMKHLLSKHGTGDSETILSSDEMTIIEENDQIKVKIIFQTLSGRRLNSSDNIEKSEIEFYLLVKIK